MCWRDEGRNVAEQETAIVRSLCSPQRRDSLTANYPERRMAGSHPTCALRSGTTKSAPQKKKQRALTTKIGDAQKHRHDGNGEQGNIPRHADGKQDNPNESQSDEGPANIQNSRLTGKSFNVHDTDSSSFETAMAAMVPSDTAVVICRNCLLATSPTAYTSLMLVLDELSVLM